MSENEMDKVKSSRTPLLLLVLVIVVVAAAAVYFLMIRPGQTPADTEAKRLAPPLATIRTVEVLQFCS